MRNSTSHALPIPGRQAVALGAFCVLFSGVSVLSDGFDGTGTLGGIFEHYGSLGGLCLAFLGTLLFTLLLGLVLFSFWGRGGGDSERRPLTRRQLGLCALLLFAAWLPWILSHYPGTMRDDTVPQLFQWYGIYMYYTQHPLIDTFVFGLFFSLGDLLGSKTLGLFIYIVLQAALSSLLFTWVISYLWKRGVGKLVIALVLVYYAFSRVVYQPIDAMSKDSLNGLLSVVVFLGLIEVIRTDLGALRDLRFSVPLALCLMLCVATKRTLLYILLAFCMVYLVKLLIQRRDARRFALVCILPILVSGFVVVPTINRVVGADENETYEMYSIPTQQIVRTLISHPDALSESEYERLANYIDIDAARESYNYMRADDALLKVEDGAPFLSSCLDIWIKLGIKYPDSYFAAWLGLAGRWFSFTTMIDYGHDSGVELYDGPHMSNWRAFFSKDRVTPNIADEFLADFDFDRIEALQPLTDVLEKGDDLQRGIYAISSYGLYCTFLPLLAFVWALVAKNWRCVLFSLLFVISTLSLLVGPLTLYWYTVPTVWVMPLLMCAPTILRSGAAAE